MQCKLVLRGNGSLYLDGNNWSIPQLETVRNRIKKVTDVVKIEQGYMASAILRSNGEVIGWAGYDLLETLSQGRKFVDIAASGAMVGALDTEGNVSIWKREGVVPLPEERLEKGYAIRASGNLFAIQKADGSWRAWQVYQPNSPAKPESAQQKIHTLGPAVDLLFLADPNGMHDAVLWLEPAGKKGNSAETPQ
ncbi:MAG: hypothetical protein P1V20_09265 [Verrucomicrobiales bacterium]|nr:hypothetical protein [Verrucomicrobiales bacterium]